MGLLDFFSGAGYGFFVRTKSTCFLLALLGAVLPAPAQIAFEIDPGFARHGIQITTPKSAAFQAAVVRLAGKDLAGQIAKLLPYSMILKSTAAQPLSSVIVRYPRKTAAGQIVDAVNANPLTSGFPGTELLLAPAGIGTILLSKDKIPPPTTLPQIVDSAFNSLFDPSRFPQTIVSLDLVIFADGGAVGPDRGGTVALEQALGKAGDQTLAILQDSSQPDPQVTSWLSGLANSQPSAVPPGDPGYIEAQVQADRAQTAFTLLQLIRRPGGRAAAAEWYRKALASQVPQPSSLHQLR